MDVYLNRIDGLDDAMVSMFISKRHLDRVTERNIRALTDKFKPYLNTVYLYAKDSSDEENNKFYDCMTKLFKYGQKHTTLLRFINLSFTVYNLHRGGQDDWDSHAQRFNNRIVRSSTRLSDFKDGEMSDWYKGKIIPTDVALDALGFSAPEMITLDGATYVKSVNGYILKGHENDNDYKRGLYMLSIPSTFIFQIQLTEFAHVYRERNKDSSANPEVKEMCEQMCDQVLEAFGGFLTREMLLDIRQ